MSHMIGDLFTFIVEIAFDPQFQNKCTEEKSVEEKEPKFYPGLQRHQDWPTLTNKVETDPSRATLLV